MTTNREGRQRGKSKRRDRNIWYEAYHRRGQTIVSCLREHTLVGEQKMPKITFYYFDGKATGESARLLLAYGGQEFEDKRVMNDWPDLKPQMPFLKIPVIEIDGKKYSESVAIASYLGHKYGLAGDTLEEDLEINQNIFFYINGIRAKAEEVFHEKDEAIKEKKHEEYLKNEYPYGLSKLDEIIKSNNGHIAAGKLTWADFVFAGTFDHFKLMLRKPDLEKEYPSFQGVVDAVYSEPKVKAYTESRPKFALNF